MAEKRQCESEGAEPGTSWVQCPDDKVLSWVLKPRHISDNRGIEDHREAQREYSGKPEVKDKIKAKQKEHRLRVSKIIFVCVFVCDFECRGKKHREHSKFLLLQKRKKRENVSHEWSLLQIQ